MIPIILIGLPATLLGLIFLLVSVVTHFRKKSNETNRWTKPCGLLAVVLLAIALCSPMMLPLVDWAFEQLESAVQASKQPRMPRPSEPAVIASEKFPALISKLPDHVGFGFSGAAYFQGKLYVSSNLGLLVIKDRNIEALLQWTKSDAVIEGPWLDGTNKALWAQSANDGSLLHFDGSQWSRMPLPEPPAGYTRGDVLDGFGGRSTPRAFWMMGGNCIWRWDPGSKGWLTESLPAMPAGSAVKAFFSWDDAKVFLVRDGYQIGIEAGKNPATIHVFDGTWRNFAGIDIDAKDTAQTDSFGFVRSSGGLLYQVSRNQMTRLAGPGRCDAIAKVSNGNLLASFGSSGIFERVGDQWEKRAASPFGSEEGEHWAHLAESDGEIALATSTVPQLIRGTDKFVYSGTAGIWTASNGVFERIDRKK